MSSYNSGYALDSHGYEYDETYQKYWINLHNYLTRKLGIDKTKLCDTALGSPDGAGTNPPWWCTITLLENFTGLEGRWTGQRFEHKAKAKDHAAFLALVGLGRDPKNPNNEAV